MTTPYKGRIRIECTRETCREDKSRADVKPGCFGCTESRAEILDLDDRVVYRRDSPAEPQEEPTPAEASSAKPAAKGRKK
ncbi:MAG: hypothetical protein ACYC7J_18360 [Syntrophales bacterium]